MEVDLATSVFSSTTLNQARYLLMEIDKRRKKSNFPAEMAHESILAQIDQRGYPKKLS